MRRLAMLALALLGAVALTACATMNVGAYREPRLDIARYHTWTWGAPDALPVGDPRLDNNPFFHDRIEGAVDRELAAHGLAHVFAGSADLRVHYHVNVAQRFDVHEIERDRAACAAANCTPQAVPYDAGTLVIDIVDARSDRLVWRGWAQESVTGVFDDQLRMERYVDAAVRKVMARFPVGTTSE